MYAVVDPLDRWPGGVTRPWAAKSFAKSEHMRYVTGKHILVLSTVITFLLVIFLQLSGMARDNSATWDEADHTYAGYMQWTEGVV